ncbi:hypothetical protein LCER1_G004484, partial [Lachnellula cervina]
MPPNRRGRHNKRPLTPPEGFQLPERNQPYRTPHRSAVFALHLMAEAMGARPGSKDTKEAIHKVIGVTGRTQTDILHSGEVRSLYNQPDLGPDPRGRPRAIPHQDTSAIGDFLDDENLPLERRSQPWRDLAEDAGVELPKTTHFKPLGKRIVEPQTIQTSCKGDESIINATCEEERLLTRAQARWRVIWCIVALCLRPRSWNWWNIVFCDEFHFGIGPQITKHIKRRRGKKHRYAPHLVHRKEVTSKDTKAKAREDDHLDLLSVFVVIGYNYRRAIFYKVSNSVGKMTGDAYTQQILPVLLPELQEKGLVLAQDADSAHKSNIVANWAKKHKMPLITLPGLSPDLSIIESMANPVKKKFHSRKCKTQEESEAWFLEVWNQEMDQDTIRYMYN